MERRGVPSIAACKRPAGTHVSWLREPQASLTSLPVSLQALVDLLLTGGLAGATAVAWRGVSPPAARLLYPYLAWLAFAAALNYCVWRDNHGPRGGRRLVE